MRRLRAIQAALGPERNAVAWLEYFKRNEPLPPSFWQFPDADQTAKLTDTVLNAFPILALWIVQVRSQVDRLELLVLLNQAVEMASNAVAPLGHSPQAPAHPAELQQKLLTVPRLLKTDLERGWNATWSLLRVVEIAADHLAADFLDQDVLLEEDRDALTFIRTRLDELRATLSLFGVQVNHLEPANEHVNGLLRWIGRGS